MTLSIKKGLNLVASYHLPANQLDYLFECLEGIYCGWANYLPEDAVEALVYVTKGRATCINFKGSSEEFTLTWWLLNSSSDLTFSLNKIDYQLSISGGYVDCLSLREGFSI